MKFLTLNTHSLQEENYTKKLNQFIEVIIQEKPNIIAMQEVNQTITSELAKPEQLHEYYPCPNETISVRQDNHALTTAKLLQKAGITCYWTWISSKIGYSKYDEGMALFSLNKRITSVESFYISKCHDYHNWKTRKALGIKIEGNQDYFFTVHMGWWNDEEEPFLNQWERFDSILQHKRSQLQAPNIWIMGDFNSPAELRNQGYDLILKSGWNDTYSIAESKDEGFTVRGKIDGWKKHFENDSVPNEMRIDQIWCSSRVRIKRSKVVFNGINGPIVSDHFGVMIEY